LTFVSLEPLFSRRKGHEIFQRGRHDQYWMSTEIVCLLRSILNECLGWCSCDTSFIHHSRIAWAAFEKRFLSTTESHVTFTYYKFPIAKSSEFVKHQFSMQALGLLRLFRKKHKEATILLFVIKLCISRWTSEHNSIM
jgi:hypothetical protein